VTKAAAVAVVLGTQHAERLPQLPGGVRARLLDRQQRGRHLFTALARQVHRHARMDLDHRPRSLRIANLLMLCLGVSMTAVFFFLSLYLQEVIGYSALRTGLAMVPATVLMVIGGLASRQLIPVVGPRRLLVIGALFAAAGIAWLVQVPVHPAYLTHILGPSLVAGAGISLMLLPLTLAGISLAPISLCACPAIPASAAFPASAVRAHRRTGTTCQRRVRGRQRRAGAVSARDGRLTGMTAPTTTATTAPTTAATTTGTANAIIARGLTKRFGATTAVDGIDLTIAEGTVFGLLGPNGAGKTTIVRILATLITPDKGQATVHGYDVATQAHQVRQLIGLTGQYASVDETLTGTENLVLIGRLTGASRKDAKDRARELLDRFRLTDAAGRAVKTYSGGMRRRLDLAASLVPRPRVLFLDEPTTGLDPRSRNGMWDIVRELVADGVTVLLTTQYLEEADQLASKIAVIDHGRLIAEGTSAELKALTGADTLDEVFLSLTGHDIKEAAAEEDDLEEVSA
jgi:oleandomycin transport system ATP-binding protein